MSQPVTQPYIAEKGFTLIELMMAIVLVGILLGIGVPSFQSMMMNSRMTGDYNSLTANLNFARSEAIKRSAPVSVCARATDDTCGDDWSVGWLVFDDAGDTPGFIDDGELVLKSALLDNANMTVNNSARLNTGAATPVERPFVQFGPALAILYFVMSAAPQRLVLPIFLWRAVFVADEKTAVARC